MRKLIFTALGVVAVEFLVAPLGGRMFDHFFPPEHGFGGMMPDIPFYQWGYASVLAIGIVIGISIARWQAQRSAQGGACHRSNELRAPLESLPIPSDIKSSAIDRDSLPEEWKTARLQLISSKRFFNTSISLDGRFFLDCEFENCTFVYNGTGPFEAKNCTLKGALAISTSDPRLSLFSAFLYELRVMQGDRLDESGRVIRRRNGTEQDEPRAK